MDEDIELFKESGRVGSRIRENSKKLIAPGESLLEIVEAIEKMMDDAGIKPAFPTTLSINDIAAHYTPSIDSGSILQETDIIKVDLGTSLDGGLSDTAYTIDLSGEYEEIVKASEDALEKAINAIKPGVSNGYIGGTIEETIKSYGMKPIANLSGHKIERKKLHAGVNIPNIKSSESYRFKENDIFAIETFATNGTGFVEDVGKPRIFSVPDISKIRPGRSRRIAEFIKKRYETLPFTDRWLRKEFDSRLMVGMAIKELTENGSIMAHPPLREVGRGMVAQTEHTVMVTDSGCEIMTA